MEEILKKLLQNDNHLLREGSKELRAALKTPQSIPALCNVIVHAQDPQIRQYGAVILRKRFTKSRHWTVIQPEVKQAIKNELMNALVNEQEKTLKSSIAQLIGTIAKHELPVPSSWPELLFFLEHMTKSENEEQRQLGFFTLNILTEVAPVQFFNSAPQFLNLFSTTLANLTDLSSPVGYFIILCLDHFIPSIKGRGDLIQPYVDMIPRIIECINALAPKRPDRANEALDFFYDLAETGGMQILTPRFKPVVNMCLAFSQNKNYGEALQLKALNFISLLVNLKISLIEKTGLVVPILDVLFKLISEPPMDEDEEEYFAGDEDEETLLQSASATLDAMCLFMDAETFVPICMQFIEPALQSNEIYAKKAAYIVLGIIGEGAAEFIKEKHLPAFVHAVYKGVTDQIVVRNAALFALGQFAEHLQPNISAFADELLTVMLALLGEVIEKAKKPAKLGNAVNRLFYALENFAENMEGSLGPYLPDLVLKLLVLTGAEYSIEVRKLALRSLGATASSAKEALLPFFPDIMGKLNVFLNFQAVEPDDIALQVEAIDTLAQIARNIGVATFGPMAEETVTLGIRIIQSTDDPDIRKSCYGLFSAVSSVLKENMAPILPTILDFIMKSIKNEEGIVNHQKDEEEEAFPVYDSESEHEEEDEDGNGDDDDLGITVENDFIEEKEESCIAIKELVENTGVAFVPYLQSCFMEIFNLLTFPNEDVKRAALEAEFELIISISKIDTQEGHLAFLEDLERLISRSALIVRVDEDKDVVLTVLECYLKALKEIGRKLVSISSVRDAILSCIKDVITNRTETQSIVIEELDEDEMDEELFEAASDLIPALGKAMSNEEFAEHFSVLLPLFNNVLQNQSGSEGPKGNTVGMIAECMEGLGECVAPHLPRLVPYLISQTKDKSDNVRNNSVFALGELALHGKEPVLKYYPDILTAFSRLLQNESTLKVIDNICGAICRLIISNTAAVPIEQVLPVLVENIPLKEDFVEDKWIYVCLTHLYALGNQVLVRHLVPVIKAAGHILHSHSPDDDTKEVVVNFVKMCRRDFPEDCGRAASELPPEVVSTLEEACSK